MIKNLEIHNLSGALRGMRNPLNSWDKSDSYMDEKGKFILGKEDIKLARNLVRGGTDHSKFIRQIIVSVDITAPLYWWKEFDTYKVGTVANSTSTMHTIHKTPITIQLFEHEQLSNGGLVMLGEICKILEAFRVQFNETKDKQHWYDLINLLPSSFLQMRTVTLNFENLRNIYYARKNHKLREWRDFCKTLEELEEFNVLVLQAKDD